MRLGTTPKYTFELPFGTESVKKAKITFRQMSKIILEKTSDCVIKEKAVEISLTQEETFLFDPRFKVDVQLRVVTQGGDVLSTDIYSFDVVECLDKEVL